MKKLFSTVCILCISLLLYGCGGGGGSSTTTTTTTTSGSTIEGKFYDPDVTNQEGIAVTLEEATKGKTKMVTEFLEKAKRGGVSDRDLSDMRRKTAGQTTTDRDGNYSFSNVQPGDYVIVASKDTKGALITSVEVKQGESKKTLPPWAIKTKGKITGKVTLNNETDHSGVLVYISGTSYLAMTDTSGSYTITDVPPGVYALTASKDGYNDDYALGVEVQPGATTNASDIVLKPVASQTNRVPTILDILVDPATVYSGNTASVTVSASDPDGDTLTYVYSVSQGTIAGNGNAVTYTAPIVTEEVMLNIKVLVSDSNNATALGSIAIFVKPEPITPLLIDSVTLSSQEVVPEGSTTLTVLASGGKPPYEYTYSASSGTITGTGNEVTYTAPTQEGIFTISITVSDSGGQSADGVANVLVKAQGQAAEVDHVTTSSQTITAYDAGNTKLWDYLANSSITKSLVADVNGDGSNEVVFGTDRDGTDKGMLYVLNNTGNVLWKVQTGKTGVFWPDEQMSIIAIRLADVDNDGTKEIITLSYHYYWYPERLAVFNANTGELEGEYWNPGRSTSDDSVVVDDLDGDGIYEIIVGSGNNDDGNAAVVYLLEGNNVSGQAPPYYGNASQGTEKWYAKLGKPVTETYPYVKWVEVVADMNGDGIKDLKVGGGTKSSPTYTKYLDGKTGAELSSNTGDVAITW